MPINTLRLARLNRLPPRKTAPRMQRLRGRRDQSNAAPDQQPTKRWLAVDNLRQPDTGKEIN